MSSIESREAAARIAIVEDELLVAMDVEMQLANLGYEVAGVADNGLRALRLIAATEPDVILMDINLRGSMDGIAIASELQRRGIDIPVVLVTAYGRDEALRHAETVAPSGYLTKPYRSQELQHVLQNVLEHGGRRPAAAPSLVR